MWESCSDYCPFKGVPIPLMATLQQVLGQHLPAAEVQLGALHRVNGGQRFHVGKLQQLLPLQCALHAHRRPSHAGKSAVCATQALLAPQVPACTPLADTRQRFLPPAR